MINTLDNHEFLLFYWFFINRFLSFLIPPFFAFNLDSWSREGVLGLSRGKKAWRSTGLLLSRIRQFLDAIQRSISPLLPMLTRYISFDITSQVQLLEYTCLDHNGLLYTSHRWIFSSIWKFCLISCFDSCICKLGYMCRYLWLF